MYEYESFYNLYLQDKQNPTYKNILKYYSDKIFWSIWFRQVIECKISYIWNIIIKSKQLYDNT